MSNSTAIDIYVRLVQRPPFFDRATRTPNATVFWLTIKEHSAAGVNVTDTPLTATSKDPWQRPLLVYRIVNPSPYITLHPNTAVLSTTAAFPALDYNNVKWINVTIEAKDLNGLTDYATVRIGASPTPTPPRPRALWARVCTHAALAVTATTRRASLRLQRADFLLARDASFLTLQPSRRSTSPPSSTPSRTPAARAPCRRSPSARTRRCRPSWGT